MNTQQKIVWAAFSAIVAENSAEEIGSSLADPYFKLINKERFVAFADGDKESDALLNEITPASPLQYFECYRLAIADWFEKNPNGGSSGIGDIVELVNHTFSNNEEGEGLSVDADDIGMIVYAGDTNHNHYQAVAGIMVGFVISNLLELYHTTAENIENDVLGDKMRCFLDSIDAGMCFEIGGKLTLSYLNGVGRERFSKNAMNYEHGTNNGAGVTGHPNPCAYFKENIEHILSFSDRYLEHSDLNTRLEFIESIANKYDKTILIDEVARVVYAKEFNHECFKVIAKAVTFFIGDLLADWYKDFITADYDRVKVTMC